MSKLVWGHWFKEEKQLHSTCAPSWLLPATRWQALIPFQIFFFSFFFPFSLFLSPSLSLFILREITLSWHVPYINPVELVVFGSISQKPNPTSLPDPSDSSLAPLLQQQQKWQQLAAATNAEAPAQNTSTFLSFHRWSQDQGVHVCAHARGGEGTTSEVSLVYLVLGDCTASLLRLARHGGHWSLEIMCPLIQVL